ncbi:hypothetical protein [Brevundimonas vesicularis]|uniref:hypothetical protein n=1 Tax=Brevundimonas vesicularis TaxID=41276 RepID=UPI0038D3A2CD
MRLRNFSVACGALALASGVPMMAWADGPTYQQPPAPIAQILDAKPTPGVSVSPDARHILLMDRTNLPSIAELAEPMLRLAGYRINPRNNGPAASRMNWLTGLSFQSTDGGDARPVTGLPADVRLANVRWSPNGHQVAFLVDAANGLELWTAGVSDAPRPQADQWRDQRHHRLGL